MSDPLSRTTIAFGACAGEHGNTHFKMAGNRRKLLKAFPVTDGDKSLFQILVFQRLKLRMPSVRAFLSSAGEIQGAGCPFGAELQRIISSKPDSALQAGWRLQSWKRP
jgi:hypothetical protein